MPEPTGTCELQSTALRYAARDLSVAECAAFESRLATDQDARDALAEAVRLSAAALGQAPPSPDRSFRAAIQERLRGCCPAWLARRAYRGHPLAWAGLGAGVVAACTVVALNIADRQVGTDAPTATPSVPLQSATNAPVAPAPPPSRDHDAPLPHDGDSASGVAACDTEHNRSVAEIWAEMSTPDHVEKAHDDEIRRKQKLRDMAPHHLTRPAAAITDGREP